MIILPEKAETMLMGKCCTLIALRISIMNNTDSQSNKLNEKLTFMFILMIIMTQILKLNIKIFHQR